MIRILQSQVPIASALMRGRTLTDFPDDLAPFGAVVQTESGDVAEIVAWLGPQTSSPEKDDPGYEAAKAFENERMAVAFVISELREGKQVPVWPRHRFVYAPESRVRVVAPPQQRPLCAFYFAIQTIGATMQGMEHQLTERLSLPARRPN